MVKQREQTLGISPIVTDLQQDTAGTLSIFPYFFIHPHIGVIVICEVNQMEYIFNTKEGKPTKKCILYVVDTQNKLALSLMLAGRNRSMFAIVSNVPSRTKLATFSIEKKWIGYAPRHKCYYTLVFDVDKSQIKMVKTIVDTQLKQDGPSLKDLMSQAMTPP